MVLFIGEDDVDALVGMDEALAAVRSALLAQYLGRTHTPPRQRVRMPDGLIKLMGAAFWDPTVASNAAVSESGWMAVKAGVSTGERRRVWIMLFDAEANLRCLLNAEHLSRLRTGAASSVAADVLAARDASVLACLGAGFHAYTQVQAITRLRPDLRVVVWSRTERRARAFAERLRSEIGLEASVEPEADKAAALADIVVTMTRASTPVLHGGAVKEDAHVILAGSNDAKRREADAELFRRAAHVYVDDIGQAQAESGDLILAAAEGAVDWSQVELLSEEVARAQRDEPAPGGITVFSSQGLALWDAALAVQVYERAIAEHKGLALPFDGTSLSKDR